MNIAMEKTRRHPSLQNRLANLLPGQVRWGESLENWTTFHCQASAWAVAQPKDARALKDLVRFLRIFRLEWRKDWAVLGKGSNLLVRDGGFPGVLIDLSLGFSSLEIVKEEGEMVWVRAEGGVGNGTLLKWLRDQRVSGFEFAFGIPGTIGGGIRMNAGTPESWFGRCVVKVEGISIEGSEVTLDVGEDDFDYRNFPQGRELIITAGIFRFTRRETEEIDEKINQAKEGRKQQPLELPNTGSVFKNTPDDYAGRLIEAAGLKGYRIGDAEISSKHANFIVNRGSAKTADVLALMAEAKERVKEKFGVDLEEELHLMGVDR